jgi:hypothetical protein
MHSLTAQEFTQHGSDEPVYLATFSGMARVGYFRSNGWAVCPDENAGFGLSFCCGSDSLVYPLSSLLERFGSLEAASAAAVDAGGHLR